MDDDQQRHCAVCLGGGELRSVGRGLDGEPQYVCSDCDDDDLDLDALGEDDDLDEDLDDGDTDLVVLPFRRLWDLATRPLIGPLVPVGGGI